MKYLPITLTATLIASLVVAMVFTPVLGATFGKPRRDGDHDKMVALEQGHVDDLKRMGGMTGAYVRVVDWALDRPAQHPRDRRRRAGRRSTSLYGRYGNGVEFFPDVEPQNVLLQIHGRGNMSIDERDALVREVEAPILALQTREARVQDDLQRDPGRHR